MPLHSSVTAPASIDVPDMRCAGRELLSLALMDARNHTLHLLGQFEAADTLLEALANVPRQPEVDPPLWLAGHIAWLAEYWIARNPQRRLGRHCAANPVRLSSIEPQADAWWNPALSTQPARWSMSLPTLQSSRAYLLDTLETTLDLLHKSPEDDDALYFYRLALCHEDRRSEHLVMLAQALGVPLQLLLPKGVTPRDTLRLPATHWTLGAPAQGFSFEQDTGSLSVDVPEFEIDAQPVSWAQFVEFVDDSGYDRPELWQAEGWAWLQQLAQAEGRRGPRHVEQIGVASGAVMQTHFGKPTRMAGTQPAMHLSWWEADAWCRWAGRRLPSEVEWDLAAHTAARRGFQWGDVYEWVGTTLHPWPGFEPAPWGHQNDWAASAWWGQAKVLRGASFATRARLKDARLRSFALPGQDDGFVGFRSCAP